MFDRTTGFTKWKIQFISCEADITAVRPVLWFEIRFYNLKIRFYSCKYSFRFENIVLDRKTGFTKLKTQFISCKTGFTAVTPVYRNIFDNTVLINKLSFQLKRNNCIFNRKTDFMRNILIIQFRKTSFMAENTVFKITVF